MTNTIENKLMEQSKNAGTAMGKISSVKTQLQVQLELHKKWMKTPDSCLMESISKCIQTLDEAYQTLGK